MSAELTPDVQVSRVKMALDDAGYPDAPVYWDSAEASPTCILTHIPDAVWWQAMHVSGIHTSCWSCWLAATGECFDGHCQHPEGPATPPSGLLRAS